MALLSVARTWVRVNREFKLTEFELMGLHCIIMLNIVGTVLVIACKQS